MTKIRANKAHVIQKMWHHNSHTALIVEEDHKFTDSQKIIAIYLCKYNYEVPSAGSIYYNLAIN